MMRQKSDSAVNDFRERRIIQLPCRSWTSAREEKGTKEAMGKADTVTKIYMGRAENFLAVSNFFAFHGKKQMRAEDLEEMDPEEILFFSGNQKTDTMELHRDLLRHCVYRKDSEAGYLLIGIENQTEIHLAMPLRNMQYDVLRYGKQWKKKQRKHKEEGDLQSGAEFLSGLKRGEKFTPVITIVVYFGQEDWDAPTSLHELLDVKDKAILDCINDYKINLLNPHKMTEEDFKKLGGEVEYILRFIRASKDKEELKKLLADYQNVYKEMGIEGADVLNICTKLNVDLGKNTIEKEKDGEKRSVVDMCKAWDDWGKENREEGRSAGLKEGRSAGLKEGHSAGLKEGHSVGLQEGHNDGLRALVESLKEFVPDFDMLYRKVKKNPVYRKVTKDAVKKYF